MFYNAPNWKFSANFAVGHESWLQWTEEITKKFHEIPLKIIGQIYSPQKIK